MNQHYIPQMYQRAWEIHVGQQRNQIYVYRINKPPVYWSITRKVGCLQDYYAFTDSRTGQFELNKAENWLSELEAKTKPIIKKVIARQILTPDERLKLSEFMFVFLHRTPSFKNGVFAKNLDQVSPFVFNEFRATVPHTRLDSQAIKEKIDELEKSYKQSGMFDELYIRTMMRDSTNVPPALAKMHWITMIAPRITKFVTCDNPFVYETGKGISDFETGFFLFPLSPEVVLNGTNFNPGRGDIYQIGEKMAQKVNRLIVGNASLQVYANFKSAEFAQFVNLHIGKNFSVN